MIRIEKIKNTFKVSNDRLTNKYGNPLYTKGLVDIINGCDEDTLFHMSFDCIHKYLGVYLTDMAVKNDIHIGSEFGTKGVDIDQLLNLQHTHRDVWFETCYANLLSISKPKLGVLLDMFKFIVHDYAEGGLFLNLGLNPYEELKRINPNLNVKIAHSGFQVTKYKNNTISIPMYALCAHSKIEDYLQGLNSGLKTAFQPYRPNKLGLFTNRKPRAPRLKMLGYLDKFGLLSDMDWTCNINYNREKNEWYNQPIDSNTLENADYKDNDIFAGATLDKDDPFYTDVENFKLKYQNQFPKELPHLEFTKENIMTSGWTINKDFIGKYKFNVVVETLITDHYKPPHVFYSEGFVSDKTFKAMLYNAPILGVKDIASNQYLKKIGFHTLSLPISVRDNNANRFYNLDKSLDGLNENEQIYEIVDFMASDTKNLDTVFKFIAEENYNKMCDQNFLAGLVINPLKEALTRQ